MSAENQKTILLVEDEVIIAMTDIWGHRIWDLKILGEKGRQHSVEGQQIRV